MKDRQDTTADRINAYPWAKLHAPPAQTGNGWPEAHDKLPNQINSLGVADQLKELLK